MKTEYLTGKYVRGGYFNETYIIVDVLPDAGDGKDYVCFLVHKGQRIGQRVIFGVAQLHRLIKSGKFNLVEVST